MVCRIIQKQIIEKIADNKAILLLGPRQCGKTTLLKMIKDEIDDSVCWFNGDDPSDSALLENCSVERLKNLIGNNRIIIIDEAQEIDNIGKVVKLITDYIENVCPIISGSSSFELSNKLNEPLTGRIYEFHLFPFSFSEMVGSTDLKSELKQIETRLIFGAYPEIVVKPGEEKEHLPLLTSSYLYKDIFKFGNIQKPTEFGKIVQLLAWQISNEVNISEVSKSAGTSSETVERYIEMLEKAYIIFRLPSFARNLRNEIKKNKKIYFYDNGIRNALISNFSYLNNRNDVGALWENYLVSERMKQNAYRNFYGKSYFWRTQQQQEIDYIEEMDGSIAAFEFKWNPNKSAKFPKTFINNYPVDKMEVINRNNMESFLL